MEKLDKTINWSFFRTCLNEIKSIFEGITLFDYKEQINHLNQTIIAVDDKKIGFFSDLINSITFWGASGAINECDYGFNISEKVRLDILLLKILREMSKASILKSKRAKNILDDLEKDYGDLVAH